MKRLTKEEFISKAVKIHNNRYSYENFIYINSITKSYITCSIHGDFLQCANKHLNHRGCPVCGGNIKSNTTQFINKAYKIHNNKYDYSLVKYNNSHSFIDIICKKHGIFKQRATKHLVGDGCPHCYEGIGFSLTQFKNYCKNLDVLSLYIVKCFNEDESFIKIGITGRKISQRFSGNSRLPYNYELIKHIKNTPILIWKEEKRLHKLFKKYKYKPTLYFPGHFECFTLDILPLIQKSTDLYPLSPY